MTSSLNDGTHPPTLAVVIYSPSGQVASFQDGCAGTNCGKDQSGPVEGYDYNNRLQAVRTQFGTASSWDSYYPQSDYFCSVYNYYVGASNPTTCVVPNPPSSGAQNNGSPRRLVGEYFRDTTNSSLSHTASYTYDHLNRLTTGQTLTTDSSQYNLTFTYDRYGNMSCQTNSSTNGPCPNWTFNSATNQITNSGFSYDAAGDLKGDGAHTYQWDAEQRLVSVDSGATATYKYNALGWRVEKQVGSTYTEILYDQSGESLGENNRTTWSQSYVNFAGRHVATYQSNATYFTHVNSLGSTTAVTDYTGAVVEDKLFYPWGQDWAMAGTLYEERFAKLQRRDSETSLDRTPNRTFSSTQGRCPARAGPDLLFGSVSSLRHSTARLDVGNERS